MTVVVAFLCTDGVVVAVDSMLTSAIGTPAGALPIAHHTGRKVDVLAGQQVIAYAGDQGQGARFRIMAEGSHPLILQVAHAIDYPLRLTQSLIAQFQSTGIPANAIGVNTVLAYQHGARHHCCAFEGAIQPRLLDAHHFYVALGSGKLSADPFLKFLSDIFCPNGQPSVREAVFLATWAVQHVIDTNPGGVAGPIRIATLEQAAGGLAARDLPDTEIEEHRQAIESAAQALRSWRDSLQSGVAAQNVADPPAMAAAVLPQP
jgi:hypothetical protein